MLALDLNVLLKLDSDFKLAIFLEFHYVLYEYKQI